MVLPMHNKTVLYTKAQLETLGFVKCIYRGSNVPKWVRGEKKQLIFLIIKLKCVPICALGGSIATSKMD
jgi:hypothetical protein